MKGNQYMMTITPAFLPCGVLPLLKGLRKVLEDVHGEKVDSTVNSGTHKCLWLLNIVNYL